MTGRKKILSNSARKLRLMLKGYAYASANKLLFLKSIERHRRDNSMGLSEEALFSLLPFNAKFDKLFGDVFSLHYLLEEHRELLPQCHFLIVRRDGSRFVLPFSEEAFDCVRKAKKEEVPLACVLDVVKKVRCVRVRDAQNSFDVHELLVSFEHGHFVIDGRAVADEEMLPVLEALGNDVVVAESVGQREDLTLHVGLLNEGVSAPRFLYASLVDASGQGDWYERNREFCSVDEAGNFKGGSVGCFDELLARLKDIASGFNELEYISFALRKADSGWKVIQVDTGEELSFIESVPPELASFLSTKLQKSTQRVSLQRLASMACRWFWGTLAKKRGFMDYMYKNWMRDCVLDYCGGGRSLKEKRWAHQRGFLSYRKHQYGLTDANCGEFLSDYEYRWLRPLNNGYRKWLWDKVSLRYSLAQYAHYLPRYYFHVMIRDRRLVPLTMPDCPQGLYSEGFDCIAELVRKEGRLAMKPTVGSHGEGFFKLEYAGGAYAVNERCATEVEFEAFLKGQTKGYVVTEFVDMHSELERIYAGASCTVRLMVINRTGFDPVIENAYYRIATSASGSTDNIGSGGVFAYVDVDTGWFHDAESIVKHVVRPCPRHPDTDVLIEGRLPHWESLKKGVLEISRYLSPLEYLGFDVVVTESGFKVLEINTHQDLHRYPTYGPHVHEYFMRKAALKKAGKQLV